MTTRKITPFRRPGAPGDPGLRGDPGVRGDLSDLGRSFPPTPTAEAI